MSPPQKSFISWKSWDLSVISWASAAISWRRSIVIWLIPSNCTVDVPVAISTLMMMKLPWWYDDQWAEWARLITIMKIIIWWTSTAGRSKKACLGTIADVPEHQKCNHHHQHHQKYHCHHRLSTWSMLWLMSLLTKAWWVGVTKHYATTKEAPFT